MISCLLYRSDLRRCRWTRRSDQQRRLFGCSGCCCCGSTSASTCTDCTGGSLLASESEASSSQEKLLPNPKVETAFEFESFPLPPHLQSSASNVSPFSRLNWKATAALFQLPPVVVPVEIVKAADADDHDTTVSGELAPPLALADLERHAILGEGSFGQVQLVSKAQPDGTRRAYALKVQTKAEENVNDIMQEMNIMKKLQHPFLVKLEASFEDEKSFYFQMPLLQGGDLSVRMKMHRSDHDDGNKNLHGLPEAHAKFYALGIADAVAYMHSQKCVHRDLKPDNVMVDSRGYPVIIDLGIAKILDSEKTHTRCGTPEYVAPELIFRVKSGYDYSVDHWSFGAVVYELVTGFNIYGGIQTRKRSRLKAMLKESVLNGKLKFRKKASDQVVDLVRKLLVKDPTRRLGSLEGGEQDVLNHPWFDGLDIVALRQRKASNVPWVPTIDGPLDTSNFPDCKPL